MEASTNTLLLDAMAGLVRAYEDFVWRRVTRIVGDPYSRKVAGPVNNTRITRGEAA